MKVLVTGAAGFVGRHLTAHLLAEGDDVVGIDRSEGPDLLDGPALTSVLRQVAPDAVYHLGGWSDVGASWDQPLDTFRTNAEGTLNLLQACVAAGSPRVLVISSADVYGPVTPEQLPIAETTPLTPITPYAASKVAADYLAVQAFRGYGLPTLRARAFNHLGPGQTTRFVAPAIADRIAVNEATGGDEIVVGNLSPRRDFTDVRDVVVAYRLLVAHGEPGEAYNVCRGVDLAIADLAERLTDMARLPMRLTPDPDLQRPVETPVLRGDATKLRAATGWEPRIGLDQTLSDILDERRAAHAGAAATT
ncbi:MAG: GDP-mannose 4,6-dehydratase [Acidimicrobiales bacterium]|jgi:GDP-4-dehydro-6-deoxy-D-mannose reductase|nr:GDP-mannose 4,6-dehydratase [Acidimicrobiales bacterium]